MNALRTLHALALALALCGSAAGAAGAMTAPRHSGLVAMHHGVQIEFVPGRDALQVYASENGRPLDLHGATADVVLLRQGYTRQVRLNPVGDRLEARGAFRVPVGTTAVVSVNWPDRRIGPARFVFSG